ncbi:MAG: hypothetical protein GF346_00315, partial [Candidatus Eisenbacteria bacterium]|nr:hypothetical protein [Candidatus Latescibacterota bacterium]MBD3300876.1 hypothetical protein [Candidatus Eisenbacteria bacterium]
GPEILISDVGAPAPNGHVVYDRSNNRYLATWRDQVDENLKGQLIDGDGTLIGGPILISSVFPSSGTAASLAFDPGNDRYLVVFGVFQGTEVYAQLVGSDGSLIGSNILIEDGLAGSVNPFVVYNPLVECYVVFWANGTTIYAQALNLDGVPTGDPLVVSSGTVAGEPVAAVNPETGMILALWTDSRNAGEGQPDIYGQLVTCTDPAGIADRLGEAELRLAAAPNPLSERTALSFRIGTQADVTVEILDAAGRRVRTLRAGILAPGIHTIRWDGRDRRDRPVPDGVYFTRLAMDGRPAAGRKLWVLR